MSAWRDIAGDPSTGLLLIADHASARVPDGIDLGVKPAVMDEHVAVDIGVAPLAEALCTALGCPAILGNVSRLVIDFNREEDAPALIPVASDGHAVPGNERLDPAGRAVRLAFWGDYHRHIADKIAATSPKLLISLHSFTPRLRSAVTPRQWEIGILYANDERAPRVALPWLTARGVIAGDNQPYSGKLLNATMNRHAEAAGLPYLGIEVRQDLVSHAAGVSHWSNILAPMIAETAESLREA